MQYMDWNNQKKHSSAPVTWWCQHYKYLQVDFKLYWKELMTSVKREECTVHSPVCVYMHPDFP